MQFRVWGDPALDYHSRPALNGIILNAELLILYSI